MTGTRPCTPLADEEIRAVLAAAGVAPDLAHHPDPDLRRAAGLAVALGQRLGLDVQAQGALAHYLRLVDGLDQRLRALHAVPAPHPAPGTHEGPAPWREPHG